MKGEKLLTLAMSETTINNFVVLAFLYSQGKIIEIELKESDFKDKNQNVIWDISAITKVEHLNIKNNRYYIYGDSILEKYLSKIELRELIDRESMNYSVFLRNSVFNYGVIKIKYIEDLKNIKELSNIKSYVEFWSEGIKTKYLIKDFRWLNYWKYKLIEKKIDEIENKKLESYYKNFFNCQEVYLILCRYKNMKSSEVYWVAAVHYF